MKNFSLGIAIGVICIVFFALMTDMCTQKKGQQAVRAPSPSPRPTDIPRKNPFIIRAAIPYWDQNRAVESLNQNAKNIDIVSVFWYYIDADGDITTYNYAVEDDSLIEFAHQNNIKISAVITNLPERGTWDSRRVEKVLQSDEATSAHVLEIKNLLLEKQFDGVTIDYESVNSSQRELFSRFIQKLTDTLHKDGKYVEVALHPKRGVLSDTKYNFQDWETLAEYADRVYIMAYEEHYNEGEAGPIASLPWVEQILEYASKKNIPGSKLLLGVPLDGYNWNTDSREVADGISFIDAQNLLDEYSVTPKWDEENSSPYFTYSSSHEVWYENARSVKTKLQLAQRENLAGVTFWKLGGEDPNVWKVVESLRQ